MEARLTRLPIVLLLMVGLLLSLLHCASCGPDIGDPSAPTVVTNLQHGAAPDVPDYQLPCHCGHCLCHVTVQHIAAVVMPADPVTGAPAFGQQQVPPGPSGLPLFKPPRA
jgi:hypothetical protein